MKPHYIYWIWAVFAGVFLAANKMIYLAPIAWLFPPLIFGLHIVTGKSSETRND
jgi:hypothetical protein